MGSIIRTEGLTKKFGDFTANDHIDISVDAQEIRCIVGENGAGKTTLMNMLYGILEPTGGSIYIRDREVHLKSPLDAIQNGIGMVHQHFKLVPSLTVYENILLGVEKKKRGLIDKKSEIKAAAELIERYDFKLDPKSRIEDLSMGERQRVEILKMLYRNIDILILDEPTAVLVPQEVGDLIRNLKELRRQGKTILVITHKLQEVLELSDTVTVIRHGKVVGNVRTADTNEEELASMMVGSKISLTVENKHDSVDEHEIVYEIKNLSTENSLGKKVVDNVSFCVHKGEILGIAGVDGNGQSELVKMMSGLMEATSGQILFQGQDITNKWPRDIRAMKIGIIPEDRYAEGLCRELPLSVNAVAGYQNDPEVSKKGFMNREEMKRRRDAQIREFDIRIADINGIAGQLSGGNAQKMIVARELMQHPKLLIACQPTRGIDVASIKAIHEKLLEYKNQGNAVILISSELSEILSLSDHIIVMYKGYISGEMGHEDLNINRLGLFMAGINKEGQEAVNE